MEGNRSNWNDNRLDDLVDRLTRFEGRMDSRLNQIDSTLHDIQGGITGTHRTMIAALVVLVGVAASGHF
jgi:hypothetical protein